MFAHEQFHICAFSDGSSDIFASRAAAEPYDGVGGGGGRRGDVLLFFAFLAWRSIWKSLNGMKAYQNHMKAYEKHMKAYESIMKAINEIEYWLD